ncbi:hypothetical protein GQ53DRAFT_761228 [Thozetella sp. PMI_491]|nr:hypothetical protein GQ53DRAFT_761228 [Thozetella sp. PMI_491]
MTPKTLSMAFAVLLGYLTLFAAASPLTKRTQLNMLGATATVQWSSNGDTINNIRNYHIRGDGMLMESKRSSGGGGWTTLPMNWNARPNGGLTATVVKLSDQQNDVEIRLFYQRLTPIANDPVLKNMYRMAALKFTPSTGWIIDNDFDSQFSTLGYVGYPAQAVTWKDPAGVQQYRLYWLSFSSQDYLNYYALAADIIGLMGGEAGGDPTETGGKSTIFELRLSSSSPGQGTWQLSNGGDRIAAATTLAPYSRASVSAVVWKDGARISVFYWDTPNPTAGERPSEIKEIRWIDGQGWVAMARPNDDFKNFNMDGQLSAVSYKSPSGEWLIDLYAKWDNECIFCTSTRGLRMVRFTSSNSGWTNQVEMPSLMYAGTLYSTPMNTIAWYYQSTLNQRMYFPRCQNPSDNNCGASWIANNMHEVSQTNRDQWVTSADIDYL